MRESKDSERRRAGWETRALGEQPQSTRRGEPGREADFCRRVKTFHPAPGASKDLAQVQSRATKCSPVQLPCTGSKVSLGRGAETGHRRSGRRTYSTFSAGPGGWERVEHPWPRKFTCTQIPQPARPPPRDGDRQGPASLWKCTAPESPARTSWKTTKVPEVGERMLRLWKVRKTMSPTGFLLSSLTLHFQIKHLPTCNK